MKTSASSHFIEEETKPKAIRLLALGSGPEN